MMLAIAAASLIGPDLMRAQPEAAPILPEKPREIPTHKFIRNPERYAKALERRARKAKR